MMSSGLRIGNRNMVIAASSICSVELRSDLDQFATPVVLDTPSFDNPHLALMQRGQAWFAENEGFGPADAARRAQLLSGKALGGVALQRLACHAEELYGQSQAFQVRGPDA